MTISTDKADNLVFPLTRRLIIFITALLALSTLSGCSTGLGVSRQNDLVGTRSEATDSYSGKYTASYQGFTGTETLFGEPANTRPFTSPAASLLSRKRSD